MGYYIFIQDDGLREIYFNEGYPNLSEIIEAAKKEFPGVAKKHLVVASEIGGDITLIHTYHAKMRKKSKKK